MSLQKSLSILLLLPLLACSSLPPTRTSIVQGHPLAYAWHAGTEPTVVFQSGLGDGMSVWSDVIVRLPQSHAYFVYDRPGYGASSVNNEPRDPCSIASELHNLLLTSHIPPPYLLVGHSIGGLYQYAFARLYPSEVAGMLLLDPTHPAHWATIQARAAGTAALLKTLRTTFTQTEQREFDDQAACQDLLNTQAILNKPAILLARGRADPIESAEFQVLSNELTIRWAELVPGITIKKVNGARHYIQKDAPQQLIDAISQLSKPE